MIKTNYIAINPPLADFTISSSDTCKNALINMTNTSPYGTNFTWLFGDGASANSLHATHSYVDSGYYTISLISTFAGCSDTSTEII